VGAVLLLLLLHHNGVCCAHVPVFVGSAIGHLRKRPSMGEAAGETQ
jgi:hypothetical protein